MFISIWKFRRLPGCIDVLGTCVLSVLARVFPTIAESSGVSEGWGGVKDMSEMSLKTRGNLKGPHLVGQCKERALGEDVRSVVSR